MLASGVQKSFVEQCLARYDQQVPADTRRSSLTQGLNSSKN